MVKRRLFYLFIALVIVAFAAGAQAWWERVDEDMIFEPLVAQEATEDKSDSEEVVEFTEPAQEPEDAEDTYAEDADEEESEKEPTDTKVTPEEKVSEERPALANRSTTESRSSTPAQDKPAEEETPAEAAETEPTPPAKRSVTYEDYTVRAGDTLWTISQDQGIPLPELLKTNNLTENSSISPGMILSIPRHQIPQRETPGERYGELLDWWTEAQYLWPIGQNARIIDFETGQSFMVRRSYGAFHADVEPLTAEDTRIMQQIWSGWSWRTRPVIVEINGRRLAASANGMPHSIQTITNNNFNGHFCIHFQNSTRHKDNLQQADHQQNVLTAAGRN